MTEMMPKSDKISDCNSAPSQPNLDFPRTSSLTLGIAPVEFSSNTFRIGRLDPDKDGSIRDLRKRHGSTHAFRFDSRSGMIANIALRSGTEPLGDVSEAKVTEHLLLLAEAISHQLCAWLSRSRTILRRFRPLICLGKRDRLLTNALQALGINSPDERLDVVAKWSFDLRLINSTDTGDSPWLGLIVDVGTSHVIDMPVSELIGQGFDPINLYVGLQRDDDDSVSASRLRLLGRVSGIEGNILILDDVREGATSNRVAASDVFLEPRPENVEKVVRCLYPQIADKVLDLLRRNRAPYLWGDRKLTRIQRTLEDINESLKRSSNGAYGLTLTEGVGVRFAPL